MMHYFELLKDNCNVYQAFRISGSITNLIFLDNQIDDKEYNLTLSDVYTPVTLIPEAEYQYKKTNSDLEVKSDNHSRYSANTVDNLEKYCLENALYKEGNTGIDALFQREELERVHIVLSPPGGGKTTWLNMLVQKYMGEKVEKIPDKILKIIEEDIKREKLPVLIRVRNYEKLRFAQNENFDISVDNSDQIDYEARPMNDNSYDLNKIEENFEDVIRWAVAIVIKELELSTEEEQREIIDIINSEPPLLIDGIDEFQDLDMQANFLTVLGKYIRLHPNSTVIITSRHKNYIKQEISTFFQEQFGIIPTEWIIEDLLDSTDMIIDFAERWSKRIYAHNLQMQEVYKKGVMHSILNNRVIRAMISTPLELTGLLFISSATGKLPPNVNEIYKQFITLSLNWNPYAPNWNAQDVEMQLSYLAYKMTESESARLIVSSKNIIDYLRKARIDQREYYMGEYSIDEDEILEFVHYLVDNTGVLVEVENKCYSFHHMQYQAYLCANQITKNWFSRKDRRRNKIGYLSKHFIGEQDDFWDQIIVLAAIQDVELRDDVILQLLEDSNENPVANRNINMLMDLFSVQGIRPFTEDSNRLFSLLLESPERLPLFSWQAEKMQKMFANFRMKECDNFINKACNKYFEIDEEQEKFDNKVNNIIFYILLKCAVSDFSMELALEKWFKYYINTGIIRQIYNANQDIVQQNNRLFEKIKSMSQKSIANGTNNYCLLIAAIYCSYYQKNLFDKIEELLCDDSETNNIIGNNMLALISWMKYARCPDIFSVKNRMFTDIQLSRIGQRFIEEILKGESLRSREYEFTITDLYKAGFIGSKTMEWYSYDLLEYECRKLNEVRPENINRENKAIGVIASFPLNDKTILYGMKIAQKNIVKQNIIQLIQSRIYEGDIVSSFIFFKVLVFNQGWNKKNIIQVYTHILKNIKDYNFQDLINKEMDFATFVLQVHNEVRGLQEDNKSFDKDKNIDVKCTISGLELLDRGMAFYYQEDYENAKINFLLAWNDDETKDDARNNLAYMLRREEITEVVKEGKKYLIPELLKEGIKNDNPFSIVNLALYNFKASPQKEKDFEVFVNSIQNIVDAGLPTRGIYSWWNDLYEHNDIEGFYVLEALRRSNCIFIPNLTKKELEKQVTKCWPNKAISMPLS